MPTTNVSAIGSRNDFIRDREVFLARMISKTFGEDVKSVLEVGCGEGSNYAYLDETMRSLDYTGVDFSFSKILFLSRMFNNEVPSRQMRLFSLLRINPLTAYCAEIYCTT